MVAVGLLDIGDAGVVEVKSGDNSEQPLIIPSSGIIIINTITRIGTFNFTIMDILHAWKWL